MMFELIGLTHNQRKLLKKLIKQSNKFDNHKIPLYKVEKYFDTYDFEYLKRANFIWEQSHYIPNATEAEINASAKLLITDEALHYFEKYREYKLEQFLNGVVWPVIVATLTSVIVNTPNWLPVLLKLMKKFS